MDFSFNEEQSLLKENFQRFMQDAYSFEGYREIIASDSGYSADIWQQFAELQWQALPFAEADGGLGYGPVELLLLTEQLGRGLCVEPYMANIVLSGQLIAQHGSAEQKQSLLPSLMDGSQQISLAHAELAGRYNWTHCSSRAEADGDIWKISGEKVMALNAPNADQLIVLARHAGSTDSKDGLGLYLVDAKAAGVSMTAHKVLGGGVAASIAFDQAPAVLIGSQDGAFSALEDVLDLATAASCADAYGAMQALLERTVEYSKTRKQFGAPLGVFQVLQHRMVDMFVEVQQTQSMILMLMLKLTDDSQSREERQQAVSACKAYVHKASKFVAQQAVQLHGGIGVTEELDVGHYFRRLTAFGSLFGDREHHLQRFAALGRQAPEQKLAAVA